MTDLRPPESHVFLARAPAPDSRSMHAITAPELGCTEATAAQVAVREVLSSAGLDRERQGTESWNPLGAYVRPGARVLLKPNWVLHAHRSGGDDACLTTDTAVLEALLPYVAAAKPSSVVIGDAPVQGCDFEVLKQRKGLERLVEQLDALGVDSRIEDFRRTIRGDEGPASVAATEAGDERDYVLFDLGGSSRLEEITRADTQFRVTMYDPDLLQQRHGIGRHQYLVARDVIDADVVINVPKLKTHKKAGLTCALKNLVGINGNKEFLPHHRKGGAEDGGDCYAGSSRSKRAVEDVLDHYNRSDVPVVRRALHGAARSLRALARARGHDGNYEGSWSGNDTVWRMCLDLHTVLGFGRSDGTIGSTRQREVITLTDAIVAGQGEGPLSPDPAALGLVSFAGNVAAADWVHGALIGMDPERVPLLRRAFDPGPHAIAEFEPSHVRAFLGGEELSFPQGVRGAGRAFTLPAGWADASFG